MIRKQIFPLMLLLSVSTVVSGSEQDGRESGRRIRGLRTLQNDTDTTLGDSIGGAEVPASSLPGGSNAPTTTVTKAPTPGNGLNSETAAPAGLDAVSSSPTSAPVSGGISPTFGGISTPTPVPIHETSSPVDGNVVGSPTPIGAGTTAPTTSEATTTTRSPTAAPVHGPTGPTFVGEPTGPTFVGEPTGPTFVGEPTGPTFVGEPTGPTFGGEPTEPHIYKPPTERPTEEYVPPPPSAGDPVEQEQEEEKGQDADWAEGKETLEELERDQRVLIALGVIGGVALLLLICTAHQMLENPDGCCASICRIMVACTCALLRCVCFPCRMICGCTGKGRNHDLIPDSSGAYTHDLELS